MPDRPSTKVALIAMLAVGILGSFDLDAQSESWPTIRPLHATQTFAAANSIDTPFLVFIKDEKGVPAYKLECHNGNFDDDSEYNFSGTFQCVLFAVNGEKRTSWNLLAVKNKDEQSTDWWNRGRILSTQLRGACTGYPEYEAVRHFRLRGMLITFQFSNLKWGTLDKQTNPELTSFTFDVSVAPDKQAQTSEAEPVKGPNPPKACY